jgi:hypothetical protein
MKKLYEFNYILTIEKYLSITISTLGDCSTNMRDYFLNLNRELTESATYIKNDLIEPLKLFIENQQILGKKFYNDFKKAEKEFNTAYVNMEKV